MQEPVRRAVAYAAALQIAHRSPSTVYSHYEGRHTHMTENYDYGTGSHLGNMRTGQLYLYGSSTHVMFRANGLQFTGYDYGAGHHFSGSVSGSTVTIYDHGESSHFHYTV